MPSSTSSHHSMEPHSESDIRPPEQRSGSASSHHNSEPYSGSNRRPPEQRSGSASSHHNSEPHPRSGRRPLYNFSSIASSEQYLEPLSGSQILSPDNLSSTDHSNYYTELRSISDRRPDRIPGSASSSHNLESRSGSGSLSPDQTTGSAFQTPAEQDITNKRKGSRKSVILAIGLTILVLLVLALVGAVVYLALQDNDHCEVSKSGGPIPTTANPLRPHPR